MKIILVNNYYYLRGGSERVFFEEMEMLRANGHEVIPFSRHYNKNIDSKYSEYFSSDFSYEKGFFLNRIAGGVKLVYSIESRKKFCRLLDDTKPDIIHAHNIYGRLTSAVLDAARAKNVPVVMTLHDYKLICPSYSMLLNGRPCECCKGGRFYNCMLTRCHKGKLSASTIYTIESYFNKLFKKYNHIKYFICPSNFLLNKHLEAGIPVEKLIHLPNFIKLDSFEPKYENSDYMLYAGRLSKEKGIMTSLKAVNGLEVLLRIVGDGPMRSEYENFVSEKRIKNVEFIGYKTGEELRELFRNAAFIVFPSECYENAPMTILEAFAYGKPVIGSNIGGIPEMVIDGETGLLFEPGNHIQLRERIEYLLSNPNKIIEIGRNARQKVEKEYNEKLHYQRLMAVYKRACL